MQNIVMAVAEKKTVFPQEDLPKPRRFEREVPPDKLWDRGGEPTPPFWTWFIENPRVPGAH